MRAVTAYNLMLKSAGEGAIGLSGEDYGGRLDECMSTCPDTVNNN